MDITIDCPLWRLNIDYDNPTIYSVKGMQLIRKDKLNKQNFLTIKSITMNLK